jgi:hypothetical protein
MPLQFFALDNQFAASTGSNVNSSPGRSKFDYPPTSSKDLVITAKDGDPDPRLFEVGDTYDVSYGGNGGMTLLDAVVIRSDSAPGGGGVIVFEGLDENGDLTQVVWTPDFDLESWYFDNFTNGNPPQFYTTDQNASYDHTFVCFAAETRIATAMGGIAAGEVWEGDHVATLDAGPQPVVWTGQRRVAGTGRNAPVLFTNGAIGNHAPLRLSQQHRVLVRSPLAELMFGASEVLVPAKALVDGVSVQIVPCRQITYVHLLLPRHQLVMAEGAPCESLLLGDMARDAIGLPKGAFGCDATPVRPILSFAEAVALRGARPPPMPAPTPPAKRPTALAML